MENEVKNELSSLNRSPKEHRLFHYTPQFTYLQDMLRNGIWPRYCIEEFDWLLGGNICIAMPMACFCDIPIHSANGHRQRYGSYALSVNKSSASDLDINPMWYLQDGTTLVKSLQEACFARPRITLHTLPGNLKRMIPYFKPTIGAQPDRNSLRDNTTEMMAFDEEMEWRYSPESLMGTWSMGYGRDSLNDISHEESLSHRITLAPNQIENVFVTKESEAIQLEKELPWLAGCVRVWEEE